MTTCPISEHAQKTPHHLALVAENKELSYQELHASISSLVAKLPDLRGVYVPFPAHRAWQTILLLFALLRKGAIACPLSPKQSPQLLHHQQNLFPNPHWIDPLQLDLTKQKTEGPTPLPRGIATCLFTSGSMGIPKIACHTLSSHFCNARTALAPLKLSPLSRYLLSLPLCHVGGLAILFRSFLQGSTVVLSTLSDLQGITHLSLVPTQLYRLLQKPIATTSLQTILVGGAHLSQELHAKALAAKLPVHTSYGMTEMSSLIALDGTILPSRNVRIENGEILVGGETLFAGYLGMEPPTWFPTGDLGTLQNNILTIQGRKDRLFISGGENIQPEEIESALLRLPRIVAARVDSINDPEFGRRPIAYLHTEGKDYSLAELREQLSTYLPPFKHPIALYPLTENEKTEKLAAL